MAIDLPLSDYLSAILVLSLGLQRGKEGFTEDELDSFGAAIERAVFDYNLIDLAIKGEILLGWNGTDLMVSRPTVEQRRAFREAIPAIRAQNRGER